jgi:hypothetical protein
VLLGSGAEAPLPTANKLLLSLCFVSVPGLQPSSVFVSVVSVPGLPPSLREPRESRSREGMFKLLVN